MDVVKVTSNGQITIPMGIRRHLNIKDGDKVLFMERDEGILMLNSSVAALKQFQKEMDGEAENAGLLTENDVAAFCRAVRRELRGGYNADND